MQSRLLHLHFRTYEKLRRLKKEAEADGAHRVAKRIHAITLNHDGLSSGEIAEFLAAPRSKVSHWLSNYEQFGFEALLEGQRPGRPGQLTQQQLVAAILAGLGFGALRSGIAKAGGSATVVKLVLVVAALSLFTACANQASTLYPMAGAADAVTLSGTALFQANTINAATAKKVITHVVPRLPTEPGWPCHRALEHAIMTDRKLWPPQTRRQLAPLLAKYS